MFKLTIFNPFSVTMRQKTRNDQVWSPDEALSVLSWPFAVALRRLAIVGKVTG
jgi:hypothetical protein